VNDFLTEKHKEITDRLKELKPMVEEHARLEAAASALASVGAAAASAVTSPGRRGPGRPRGSAGRKKAKVTKAAKAAKAAVTTAAPAKVATAKPAKKAAKKAARKKAARAAGAGRPGRRKGSGTRAAEALAFVQGQPGITIPELAAKMGIKQNYLYRVLPGLEQEKKVSKKGRGWFPAGS
jgi:hypothetical protein